VVVAPAEATCLGNTIDYFVVSQALAPAVHSVAVVRDEGFHPHSPVRLTLRAAPRRIMVRKLVSPKRVPAQLPPACLGDWEGDNDAPVEEILTTEGLDAAYDTFITQAEAIWYNLDGSADRATVGARAAGPRMRWTPALGPPTDGYRYSSHVSRMWRSAARYLRDIARAASFGEWQRGNCGTARQADTAWRRLCAAAAPSHRDSAAVTEHRRWMEIVIGHKDRGAEQWTLLVEEAAWYADRAEADVRRRLNSEWQAWLHGGPCEGLGRQHQYTRTPIGWSPVRPVNNVTVARGELDDDGVDEHDLRLMSIPPDAPAQPPCAQAAVEAEMDRWAGHWQVGEQEAELNWPARMGELPAEFVVEHLLMAAATFPEATGLGWDNVHPRALMRLTRRLLRPLVTILLAAERLGRWPSSIALVLISLLPKADAGATLVTRTKSCRPGLGVSLEPSVFLCWGAQRGVGCCVAPGLSCRPGTSVRRALCPSLARYH
jgi:hypothetical protein